MRWVRESIDQVVYKKDGVVYRNSIDTDPISINKPAMDRDWLVKRTKVGKFNLCP